jgi:NMD protein affecting ribosome stability and mRNA decay
MCVDCIRTHVDISEGIPKQATLHWCKFCERYLQPPGQWLTCALESRELLALCLKKLKGLGKVRLVDAGFVWTEPHSKRVKVKLTIQKEVRPHAMGHGRHGTETRAGTWTSTKQTHTHTHTHPLSLSHTHTLTRSM